MACTIKLRSACSRKPWHGRLPAHADDLAGRPASPSQPALSSPGQEPQTRSWALPAGQVQLLPGTCCALCRLLLRARWRLACCCWTPRCQQLQPGFSCPAQSKCQSDTTLAFKQGRVSFVLVLLGACTHFDLCRLLLGQQLHPGVRLLCTGQVQVSAGEYSSLPALLASLCLACV